MKKVLLGAGAVALLALSSCNKCSCVMEESVYTWSVDHWEFTSSSVVSEDTCVEDPTIYPDSVFNGTNSYVWVTTLNCE